MKQGWNKSGHIPSNELEQFWGPRRAIWVCQRAPKRIQNGQKRPFSAIADLVAPNWWNKVKQGWNKSRHIPSDELEQFCGSGRAIWVCQRALKASKTAFFGHKRIWSLQTGGTVWNKGGTSQGTSTVMHWNSFGGQGGPYGCARGPPKRSKTAKNSLFGP